MRIYLAGGSGANLKPAFQRLAKAKTINTETLIEILKQERFIDENISGGHNVGQSKQSNRSAWGWYP